MADPTLFTPVTDNTLLPFSDHTLIAQGDDNEEGPFDITPIFEAGFTFGTRTFQELFIGTNGGVDFIPPGRLNTTTNFPSREFIIVPFGDDLDSRTLPPGADPGIYFGTNTDRDSVVVTWSGIGIFSNNITAPNTFQLELRDLGENDAEIIFRFEEMGNSRGDSFEMGAVADGFPRVFLRGGTTEELGDAADMDTQVGNTGVAGVWQMRVIDGQLQPSDFDGLNETGNANDNTLNGTDRNDTLSGGEGNDTINGLKGIDELNGDAGADTIFGNEDDDILRGGSENDTLRGGDHDDRLFGDEGDDELYGESGDDTLDGGPGADDLFGDNSDFASYGSSPVGVTVSRQDPSLNTGDAAGDTYSGGLRNIIGSAFDDDITGNNNPNILRGGEGNDALQGADGSDQLFGDAGNDTIGGGDNNDSLAGGAGADVLQGGPGDDLASHIESPEGLRADLDDASTNTGEATGDSYASIEGLIGSQFDDMLYGSATENEIRGLDGNDLLVGRDGDDTLRGGDDDDILNGGLGADNLFGESGSDTASYADATTGVVVDFGNTANNTGEATGDTYSSVENILGSGFDDTLRGNGSDNIIDGAAGNDTLQGNSGDDVLRGGSGADSLDGGGGSDTADYSNAGAGVVANLFDPTGNTGDARGDTYNSIENLTGSEFDDQLFDNGNNNMLMGLGGNDQLSTQGGTNAFDGGDGTDTVIYTSAGFITVDLEDNTQNAGGATGDTFVNVENITATDASDDLLGDGENNVLSGRGNVDTINGRGGDDTIDGGAGNDVMTGGAGMDSFVMSLGMGDDVITDFTPGEDSLDFSALSSAERDAVTFSANGSGDRVVTLGDGSTVTLTGVPLNVPATGAPTITGTARQGETLTAETGDIADVDGLGSFGYQWSRGGTPIDGATSSTYQPTQDDVGQTLTVTVSFTDGFGNSESSTSTATSAVENVNDAPTGAVSVTGTPTQGETLTADVSAVSDADGIDTTTQTFQWQRDGVDVPGATSATYTLTQGDVGAVMTVIYGYTDNGGATESVTSAGTSAVANVNDAPTGDVVVSGTTAVGDTLTANADTLADADGLGTLSFQWLRDGVEISGATSSTYVLTSADEDTVITARASYTDGGGTNESVTSSGTTIGNPNDAPVGSVVITGTATRGETLTADVSGVSDADGIDTSTQTFQWLRDGVAISGANSAAYTLTEADVGAVMSVTYGYTDDGGTTESVTSAGSDPVDPGIVDLTLIGTPGNDALTGGEGNDTIRGLDGDDRLIGNAGNDSIEGGDGQDRLNGGDGNDSILGGETTDDRRDVIFGGAGDDTINAGHGNDQVFGQDGNDILSGGFGVDDLQGQNGNDTINGAAFSDLVFGGAGDDFVNGGFGFDRINGGTGADKFFHAAVDGHGSDWVQDYSAPEGDVLVFGGTGASASDFVVRFAHTATPEGERSGDDTVQEAFVNFRGETLWALVDGAGQDQINIQIGADTFDLLA